MRAPRRSNGEWFEHLTEREAQGLTLEETQLLETMHVCEGLRRLADAAAALTRALDNLRGRVERTDGRLDRLELWLIQNVEALARLGLSPYPQSQAFMQQLGLLRAIQRAAMGDGKLPPAELVAGEEGRP